MATGAAGGVAVWLSFPPLGWWWAAPLGVAALVGATAGASKRVAGLSGLAHGAAFLILLLSFVRMFGIDAWLVLAAGEAVFFAGLGLLLRWAAVVRWWPLAAAGAWVVEEAVRDRVPFGGFPWGRLADAQAGGPIAPLAALGGAPLVTFAVALSGGLLAYGFRSAGSRGGLRRLPVAAAGAAAVAVVGLAVPLGSAGTSAGGPPAVTVALVQGNVPRLGLQAFAQRYAVTRNHVRETEQLAREVAAGARPAPQAVIWPENSSDLDPLVDGRVRAMISRAAARIGVPILVGAVLNGPGAGHVRNAGIVWSPTAGPGQMYVKRHLLPFGEYLPFRSELSQWIGRFSMLRNDFVPGRRPGVLQLGPLRIADAICFEIADDAVVRQAVTAGGRILVNQTNDASYEQPGDTGSGGESAQQLQITRLRAIEHGRAALVTSTSGLSAVVAPDGRVLARSRIFAPAILEATVPLRDPLTLADRLGGWPEALLSVTGVAGVVWGFLRRRRAHGTQEAGSDTDGSTQERMPVEPVGSGPA